MNKWFTVLCYESEDGPAFKRTNVFTADTYESACEIGERILDDIFPEEVKRGYNNWTISLGAIMKEAESIS